MRELTDTTLSQTASDYQMPPYKKPVLVYKLSVTGEQNLKTNKIINHNNKG